MDKILFLMAFLLLCLFQGAFSQCTSGQYVNNNTCQPCPPNTYSTTNDALQCEECFNCSNCNPISGNCTSCLPGYQPEGQNCQECPPFTFSQSGMSICQSCDETCLTCSSTSGMCTSCPNATYLNSSSGTCQPYQPECMQYASYGCTSCSPGYELLNGTCSPCPNDTYSLGGTQYCLPCSNITYCLDCNTNGTCSICQQNYTLILNNYACGYPCADLFGNCSFCQYDQCVECDQGYNFNSTSVCVPNCIAYNCDTCFSNGTCQTCPKNYGYSGQYCLPCSTNQVNCVECIIINNCTFCEEGYIPVDGVCWPGGVKNCQNANNMVCQACNGGYYLNNNNTCSSCIANCQQCYSANQCQSCNYDATLSPDGSQCFLCNINNCQSCSANNVCSSCEYSYGQPFNNTCYLCGIAHCTDCPYGEGYGCTNCLYSYYLNQMGNCAQCTIPLCQTCSMYGGCQQCNWGYMPSPDGNNCYQCSVNNCQACSSDNYCGTCFAQYLEINGTCLYCGTPNCANCYQFYAPFICNQCNPGYVLNSTTNTCICPVENCQICQQVGCQLCDKDYLPSANLSTCIFCENMTNCFTCSAENYCAYCFNGYTLINGTCIQCDVDYCAICSAQNYCSNCVQQYYEIEGQCQHCSTENCVQCPNNTCSMCGDSYALFGQQCVPQCIIAHCVVCGSSLGTCASCNNGHYVVSLLSMDKTQCLYECSVPNCLSCISQMNCGNCSGNMQVYQGSCYICQVQNCLSCSANNTCQTCHEGYQLMQGTTGLINQCVPCPVWCSYCQSSNFCLRCNSPYNYNANLYGICFLCFDPNCASCNNASQGTCNTCKIEYTLINNTCVPSPPNCGVQNCQQCGVNSLTICQSCNQYYELVNGSCQLCPNAPICTHCSGDICYACNSGYYLNNGTCQPCQPYCSICINATYCQALYQTTGRTLVQVYSEVNWVASCDPNCITCSTADTEQCLVCMPGYYLDQQQVTWNQGSCTPCASSSHCYSCLAAEQTQCLSCFPGYFLALNLTCSSCSSPCASCTNNNPNTCTSCVQGYIFIASNNTCMTPSELSTPTIDSCFSQYYDNFMSNSSVSCFYCLPGFVLIENGCAPCITGCKYCNPTALDSCLQCMEGWTLNSSGMCNQGSSCAQNCAACNEMMCTQCVEGTYLNQAFECQLPCQYPCATCQNSNPTSCLSCLYGFTMNNGFCIPDDCSSNNTCLSCPLGSVLNYRTCISCQVSNCARCYLDATMCTICNIGYFLSFGNTCQSCLNSCSNCLSPSMCLDCAQGYIAAQLNRVEGNNDGMIDVGYSTALVDCVACTSPCATCKLDMSSCTSCIANYTLKGSNCISSFNYQVNVLLNVNMQTFQDNYLGFMNQVASAAGVPLNAITVLSITSGSVSINLVVNSPNAPGSQAAVNAQNNLTNLLQSGGTVNSMPVASSALTTQGGTNNGGNNGGNSGGNNRGNNGSNSNSGGLSQTDIILMAVLIPTFVLGIIAVAVICYCLKKKAKRDDEAIEQETTARRENRTTKEIEDALAKEVELNHVKKAFF